MAKVTAIMGVKTIVANIKKAQAKLAAGCERGCKLAGLALQRESQKLVPVDFGILKASAFTRSEGKGFNTEVNVGYTAGYALYVHELVDMKLRGEPRPAGRGRYWDPQGRGQAKFLEEPARRMAKELRDIIQQNMKI